MVQKATKICKFAMAIRYLVTAVLLPRYSLVLSTSFLLISRVKHVCKYFLVPKTAACQV